MKLWICAAAVAVLLGTGPSPAHAAPACSDPVMRPCAGAHGIPHSAPRARRARSRAATVVGRRPPGCPQRYCGCALSLKYFGRIVPALNLALNWARRFPRTAPAPGMVAARSGHVMMLKEHRRGPIWLVYDPNSGGGKTRLHERSIAGFTVVNPRAAVASRGLGLQ